VKLLNAVGIKKGVEIVKRFGITNKMAPYLPSALGATEVPLIEMVAAYCTFPNAGMRPAPFYIRRITDSEGRLLEERQPELNKAISPYVAATMVSMMEGVVQSGTAARIKADADLAKWPIAGKTGTVNDFTDAWFIGYTPEVAAGFWVGYPGEKRTLGEGETGAEAALPVWIDFMKYYIKERPIVKFPETPKPEAEIARLQEKRRKQQEININLNAIGADALPDNGEMLLNNNNLSQPDPDLPPPPPPPKRPLVFEGEEEEDGG
jgi:penicillin-binding protein 1A